MPTCASSGVGGPHWVALRLLVVFAVLHGLFVLSSISVIAGYIVVALVAVACISDFTGTLGTGAVVVGYVFYEWVFWFPKGRAAILNEAIVGRAHGEEDDQALLGCTGVALTALAPTGRVRIRGEEKEARCDCGVIEQGAPVRVESMGDFELFVVPMDEPS